MNVILGVTIENMREFRGMGIRFAAVKKETLQATAMHWHARCLVSHFTPNNNKRYPMDERNLYYLTNIKRVFGRGQGKFVLLKLSEKSQRWMNVFVDVTGTSHQATLRMRPPNYFANPFIGSFVDNQGKKKTITRQPDKPAEVTSVNDADRVILRQFMESRLQQRIRQIVTSS